MQLAKEHIRSAAYFVQSSIERQTRDRVTTNKLCWLGWNAFFHMCASAVLHGYCCTTYWNSPIALQAEPPLRSSYVIWPYCPVLYRGVCKCVWTRLFMTIERINNYRYFRYDNVHRSNGQKKKKRGGGGGSREGKLQASSLVPMETSWGNLVWGGVAGVGMDARPLHKQGDAWVCIVHRTKSGV